MLNKKSHMGSPCRILSSFAPANLTRSEPTMPTRPRVSVLIPSYNHAKYLHDTLGSILTQTYTDFELIIIDDGSTDDSFAIIEAYAAKDARIRAWRQPNAGLIPTLNRLVDAAQGEFIAQIDSDDMWLPQRLDLGVRDMEAHPNLAAVFCSFVRIDANNTLMGDIDHFRLGGISGRDLMKIMAPHNCVCACAAFMRRSAVLRAAPFARPFTLVHDWDRWLRLSLAGELMVTGDVAAMHRKHGKNQSLDQATSLRQQFAVAEEMGPRVIEHYNLGDEVRMRWHSQQANRLIQMGAYAEAQARLRVKAQLGGLTEAEKIWLLQCLFLDGQQEAAAHLAHSLHARRDHLGPLSLMRLDEVRGHLSTLQQGQA
jgi:glycosyltransferase involved in cell wall biosynthesis